MEIKPLDNIELLPEPTIPDILAKEVANPIWIGVSTAAIIGGVQDKTIRRAIKAGELRFRISSDRYYIDVRSLIRFLHTRTKIRNKFYETGLGQYIEKLR